MNISFTIPPWQTILTWVFIYIGIGMALAAVVGFIDRHRGLNHEREHMMNTFLWPILLVFIVIELAHWIFFGGLIKWIVDRAN